MRNKTERTEILTLPSVKLVGTNEKKIYNEAKNFLLRKFVPKKNICDIYGKGNTATKIEKVIRKIPDKSATSMNNALIDMLKDTTVKTITYDNGSENMKHDELNKLLGCKSYFCRPYCSADKGSIENRNKILRQFCLRKLTLT